MVSTMVDSKDLISDKIKLPANEYDTYCATQQDEVSQFYFIYLKFWYIAVQTYQPIQENWRRDLWRGF